LLGFTYSHQQGVILRKIGNFFVGTDHLIQQQDVLLPKIGIFIVGNHHLIQQQDVCSSPGRKLSCGIHHFSHEQLFLKVRNSTNGTPHLNQQQQQSVLLTKVGILLLELIASAPQPKENCSAPLGGKFSCWEASL
jgi:hypothetical protein